MEDKILIILASGKSSRFGGFPKAFCQIGNKYIVQNTIDRACNFYKKIYLVLNREIYPAYYDKLTGCTVIEIETGIGDAHSLLRALHKIEEAEKDVKYVTVCWGDTYFYEGYIFEKVLNLSQMFTNNAGFVVCSNDIRPYAWFETREDMIVKSHFANEEKEILQGIHDQSLFLFDIDIIVRQLEQYKEFLNIKEDMKDGGRAEMKLLNAFTFFYEHGLAPIRFKIVPSGLTKSFNTIEEFEEIRLCQTKG